MATPVGFRLTLGGRKLERKDFGGLGKSDPFLCIYADDGQYKGKHDRRPPPVFKTEIKDNELNPTWKPFVIFFDQIPGGMHAPLLLECYDYDNDGNNDLIGEFRCTFAQLIDPNSRFLFVHPRKKGPFYKHSGHFVCVEAVPLFDYKERRDANAFGYWLTFRAASLAIKDLITSDPFLIIKAVKTASPAPGAMPVPVPGANPVVVAKTEVIKNNLNPIWKSLYLDTAICGGPMSPIEIECWDYDDNHKHDLIGRCVTTLHELRMERGRWPLIDSARKSLPGHVYFPDLSYRNSGELFIIEAKPHFQPLTQPKAFRFYFEGKHLDRKDLNGKSDPYFIILGKPNPLESFPYHWNPAEEAKMRFGGKSGDASVTQLFKSEVINRELNPKWLPIEINVHQVGGIDAPLEIQVFDWDARGAHDFIGGFGTSLRELAMPNASFGLLNSKLIVRANAGIFRVGKVEEIAVKGTEVPPYAFQVTLSAIKVERKDFMGLGKSDPFLVIVAQPYGQRKAMRVLMTEWVLSTTEPKWKPLVFSQAMMGGWDSPFTIECWDHDFNSRDDFIGSVTLTLREMQALVRDRPQIALINPYKKGRIGYFDSGQLCINEFKPMDPPANYVAPQTFQAINWNPPPGFEGATITQTVTSGAPIAQPGTYMAAPGYGPPQGQQMGYPGQPQQQMGMPPQQMGMSQPQQPMGMPQPGYQQAPSGSLGGIVGQGFGFAHSQSFNPYGTQQPQMQQPGPPNQYGQQQPQMQQGYPQQQNQGFAPPPQQQQYGMQPGQQQPYGLQHAQSVQGGLAPPQQQQQMGYGNQPQQGMQPPMQQGYGQPQQQQPQYGQPGPYMQQPGQPGPYMQQPNLYNTQQPNNMYQPAPTY